MNQQTIRKHLTAVFFALPAVLLASDDDITRLGDAVETHTGTYTHFIPFL